MRVLAVLMKYDYGIIKRGYSYEYYNIFLPLQDVLGEKNVVLFDFMTIVQETSREEMNRKLLEITAAEKPDITIFCMFENEFEPETVLRLKTYTKTVSYFIDDPWRQKFARFWIKYFDYFSTPDYYMSVQYQSEGIKNVIFSPFGYNSKIYVKKDLPKIYDVSFVGGFSPLRKWIFSLLGKKGINVKVFGRGWSNDKNWVSQEKMVDIFNQSKINLNLSNSISLDLRFLTYSAFSPKALKDVILLKKNREQVKGRHYEINACGGFQLSYFVPGLNIAYEIDNEIAVFDNVYNLHDYIRFFLSNDSFRNSIAEKGYLRSQKEHSAQHYLKNLIDKVNHENSKEFK